jgi:hypothetical protein
MTTVSTEIAQKQVDLNSMMGMTNFPIKRNEGKVILGTIQSNKKENRKRKLSTCEEQMANYTSK